MRETKVTINPLGGGYVARVIERPYGHADWLLCEEFDVTKAVNDIVYQAVSETATPLFAQLKELRDELEDLKAVEPELLGDG